MDGGPEFVMLKYQAWLETADFEGKLLGAIVKEYLNPTSFREPDNPLQYNHEPFAEGAFTDFAVSTATTAGRFGVASLKSLADFSFFGRTSDEVHLKGKRIRWKRLQRLDRFWEALSRDAAVRARVPRWIKFGTTWSVCLVVGIMICEDVDVSVENNRARGTKGNAGTPRITIGEEGKASLIFSGKSEGSKIFALELKRVTTRWLSFQTLKLKSAGPRPKGRLLSKAEYQAPEEGQESVHIEDMMLEKISGEELAVIGECM
ncbi:uncharacterized protein HRG_02526 [Hirsutella rhossiliensis]|uniref:Uncharacterized protein n=1 Tax=Hirsutella rhossiliensis TaxID=111463 RepID=A0A9P8N5S8_9HYPO|nr:uncharacterized protein HRG_02526 [Hirsutella rhossiliensis]KAH0967117.1 hypothetical protein HRG_02526 [Hirsutella rhossiliensis]